MKVAILGATGIVGSAVLFHRNLFLDCKGIIFIPLTQVYYYVPALFC